MKSIKIILLFILMSAALNGYSQTKEVIYIRIQENIAWSGMFSIKSYMSIIFPDQTSKQFELKKLQESGKNAEENGKIIQRELSTLINDGYEINSSSVGADFNVSTTVIILTRKGNGAK